MAESNNSEIQSQINSDKKASNAKLEVGTLIRKQAEEQIKIHLERLSDELVDLTKLNQRMAQSLHFWLSINTTTSSKGRSSTAGTSFDSKLF